MALLDTLNKIRNRKPTAQPQAMGGELGAIARQSQVGAKQSVGPSASSIGEQQQAQVGAVQQQAQQGQANLAAGQVEREAGQQEQALGTQRKAQQQGFQQAIQGLATKAQIGAGQRQTEAGIAEQQLGSRGRMQTEQINNGYNQALDKMAADLGMKQEDIFRGFQQSNKQLEDRRDAAQLEQVAHAYSMQDKAYVDQINRITKKRQLEDDVRFNEEANSIILGGDIQQVLRANDINLEMATNDAELLKELAKMDIDTALAISRSEAKAESTKQMIEGTTSLAKSAEDYGTKKKVT